jgi:6-phosphogluconolactonase
MIESIVKIFPTPYDLAMNFASEMVRMINEAAKEKKPFTIALSGGSTPELLFRLLAEKFGETVPWQYVHFFWGDERCVSPTDGESNFGMTSRTLLSKITIPEQNIHRIAGDADPAAEAMRYGEEISRFTSNRNGIPCFNLVILGLGEDGHTASIFPGHLDLLDSEKNCAVASHPVTGQKRITITGMVINNADNVTFLVTGEKKALIVEKLFKKNPVSLNYPAAYAVPIFGLLSWFLDKEAAMYVSGD